MASIKAKRALHFDVKQLSHQYQQTTFLNEDVLDSIVTFGRFINCNSANKRTEMFEEERN